MKNFFKKLISAVCAVSASVVLLTASVTALAAEAPRSLDEAGAAVTDTVNTSTGTDGGVSVSTNTGVAPAANNVAQSAGKTSGSKSSIWSGLLWFILSVIVNFILSCWVGNRFYRMARKNAQGSAEIRALRKDIEEKFAGTISDISEPATEVINRNENYARNDDGITMPERKSHVELNENDLEMMKRWDLNRSSSKSVRDTEPDNESEDDFDDEAASMRRPTRSAYQPTRRSSGIEFDDDEAEYEDEERPRGARRPSRMPLRKEKSASPSTISNAKNKAKDFLSNVFPFDE